LGGSGRLAASIERGGPAADAAASKAPLSQGSAVAATIRTRGDRDSVRAWLEANNALIANVGQDVIEAYVPASVLAALDRQAGVTSASAIIRPHFEVTSQGAAVHNAPNWNANGRTGAGVKVGIIDGGFIGYSALIGSELPTPAAVRCYTSVGVFSAALADCQIDTNHGTAVAETIVDVAPQVQLYLATPFSKLDLQKSVAWMASQGVQVINMSMSWRWDGYGDGTSPYSDSPLITVNQAVSNGIVWVNSAGNQGQTTLMTGFNDPDLDNFHNFYLNDETNQICLVYGQQISVQLRWSDSWGYAARDVDLYLYNASLISIASSVGLQNGTYGHVPFESISFVAPYTGCFYLVIKRFSGLTPAWMQLQAMSSGSLGYSSTGYSITSPAESANSGLLAVGAAPWYATSTIESYSSKGPTPDGRTKPDIVGADCATTVSSPTFCGTSQAAPHVAGLVALVRQAYGGSTANDVAAYMRTYAALDRGPVGIDNTWGAGLAFLPTIVPPTATFTATPTSPPTATPTVTNTPTITPPPTVTPTPTNTGTATATSPPTTTPTFTQTPTNTPTSTPTFTPSPTRTPTPTFAPPPTTGALTWYFAEGYTGEGFDEYITLQNPNPSAAALIVTYYLTGQAPILKFVTVPGNSRYTIAVHEPREGVGRGKAVSAFIQSINYVGVVAERPIYFTYTDTAGRKVTGGHNVMGVQQPRNSWYFAEGWTGDGFDEYLTIMNPSASSGVVNVSYFLQGGGQSDRYFTVPAQSRLTVAVHDPSQGVGRNRAVSARVTSTVPGGIVVERPMYFTYAGTITGGHTVMGAAEPRKEWYFPEAQTRPGWSTYVTLLNVHDETASVVLSYFATGNNPTVNSIVVPGRSRYTIDVNGFDAGIGPGRHAGIRVQSTVPLVAERPVYFQYGPAVNGGFNVMGASQIARTWLFAEGYTGAGFDEYLVMMNPNSGPVSVRITYFLPAGGPIVKTLAIAGYSVATVAVHDPTLGVGRNQAVSAKVEVTSGGGIVVERPMFFIYGSGVDGGHTVMGYVP
jgi:subtilisin family serine protease